jgi:hypothetical protein
MRRIILSTLGWCACGCLFVSLAQEVRPDTLRSSLPEYPLAPDTVLFKMGLNSHQLLFPKPDKSLPTDRRLFPEPQLLKDSALYVILEKHHFRGFGDRRKPSKPIFPWEITPDFNFNIHPSRWDLPLLGTTLTFSPTLSYQPFDRMILYGGVGFTQYPNLRYVQNLIAPDWPTKSNITSQAFGGFAYALHERITLHGNFQHSLFNQMPSNLIPFAPAYNTMSIGADIDVWQGLGVTVDRVWEFDQFGRPYQYTRYSPYINMDKFLKFLGL